MGYRSYNPALFRFTSPDSESPFGVGGVNLYAYCVNDPINCTDPSGHGPVTWLIRKTIGLAVRAGLNEATADSISTGMSTLRLGWMENAAEITTSLSTGCIGLYSSKDDPDKGAKMVWASVGIGAAVGGYLLFQFGGFLNRGCRRASRRQPARTAQHLRSPQPVTRDNLYTGDPALISMTPLSGEPVITRPRPVNMANRPLSPLPESAQDAMAGVSQRQLPRRTQTSSMVDNTHQGSRTARNAHPGERHISWGTTQVMGSDSMTELSTTNLNTESIYENLHFYESVDDFEDMGRVRFETPGTVSYRHTAHAITPSESNRGRRTLLQQPPRGILKRR